MLRRFCKSLLAVLLFLLGFVVSAKAQLTYYTSLSSFNATTTTTLVEDFELASPKDTNVSSITHNGNTYTGIGGSPSPNVVIASPGYTNFGVNPTTTSILTAGGNEDFTVTFGTPKTVVGFDTYTNNFGPVSIKIYGASGLLGTYLLTQDSTKIGFFGVIANEPITVIRWTGVNGSAVNTGIDNILAGSVLPTPPPVAYYRFNEGPNGSTVSTITDSGPNGLNGVAQGSRPLKYTSNIAAFSTSGGFALDASGDFNYGGVPHNSAMVVQGSLTVEVFVRPNSPYDGTNRDYYGDSIVIKQNTLGSGYHLAAWGIAFSQGTGIFFCHLGFAGDAGVDLYGTHDFRDGKWHHVAMTLDRSATVSSQSLTLYVDGIQEAQTTGNWPDLYYGVQPLLIGAGNYATADGTGQYRRNFGGLIDEVRITSVALKPYQFLNSALTTTLTTSTFDSNTDGWLGAELTTNGGPPYNPLRTSTPDWISTGGNPGGYIQNSYNSVSTFYWSAPAKFLGNFTTAYGGTLSFDLFDTTTNSIFNDEDIILKGGGVILVHDLANIPLPAWTSYAIGLNESGWKINSRGGTTATRQDMLTVLNNLSSLYIRGEYYNGADTRGLDNVKLSVGSNTFYTSITNGPNEGATVCGSGATFTFTGTSTNTPTANLKYQYRVDGGAFSAPAASATATLTGLADGAHTFQVAAVDQYGYADPNPATRHFTLDGTLPAISNVQSGGANDSSVGIVWTTNKAATSQVKYRIVGATNFDGSGLNTSAVTAHQAFLSGLKPNTNYQFYVISQDACGNTIDTSTSLKTFQTLPDTTAPVVGFTVAPANGGSVGPGNVVFQWTGHDDATPDSGLTFQYQLDGGAWTPAVSGAITTVTLNFPAIAPNAHTFTVRAYDASGNVSAPASVTFTVDGTAPVFTALTAGNVTFNSAQINWTTNKPTTGQVQYDAGNGNFDFHFDYPPLSAGHALTIGPLGSKSSYRVRVIARDAAGNTATSPILTLTTLPAHDLSVSASDLSFSDPGPASGDRITLSAKIHNVGDFDETATVVFYDSTPANGSYEIGRVTVSAPMRGAIDPVAVSPPFTVLEGPHKPFVQIINASPA